MAGIIDENKVDRMNPIQSLEADHDVILRILESTIKICDRMDAGDLVPAEHLENLVRFIREFADGTHHAKEEDILFPAMEQAGIPNDGGPVGIMLIEHNQGREFVAGLAEGIAGYKAGDPEGIPQVMENARAYVVLLFQHIQKENQVLYPMAQRAIDAAGWKAISAQFEEVDRQAGQEKIDDLMQIAEDLASTYLD
jgi:hemerythrin-like domain-containing protein